MNEMMMIVGMGEIGTRFANAATSLGIPYQGVTRETVHTLADTDPGTPLLVCVRENDLPGVLTHVPTSRSGDLIVVQNGFIEELIEPYTDVTRGVLWFTSKGIYFLDLLGSPVFGPRTALLLSLINAAGASGEAIIDQDVFRRFALEKAIWSCIVGAPLAVWGTDLASARHDKMAEIEAIVREACDVVRVALGAEIAPGRVLATLDDSSAQLGWMRGGTKAIAWRNGKIVEWGARCGIPTPANRRIVDAAAAPERRGLSERNTTEGLPIR